MQNPNTASPNPVQAPGQWVCPRCGTAQDSDGKFCGSCGMQKTESPPKAPPVPRYVKFLEAAPRGSWKAYDYQFISYDKDFTLSCAQAIIDLTGCLGNATRTPAQGEAEEELTSQLLACGRKFRDCAPFQEDCYAIALGINTRGMLLKTFLYPGSSHITIMASGAAGEEQVTRFLNEVIHKAVSG